MNKHGGQKVTLAQTEGLPFLNGLNAERRRDRKELKDRLLAELGPLGLKLSNRVIKRLTSTRSGRARAAILTAIDKLKRDIECSTATA